MIFKCANPNCSADFLHLYESELFLIELPDRIVHRYWLCGACAPHMCVVSDPIEGVRIVPRQAVEKPLDSETGRDSTRKVA
jgi:hypothetical protein